MRSDLSRYLGLFARTLLARNRQELILPFQLMSAADRRAKIHPDGTLRPVSQRITSVCVTMAKMVQRQRVALETAMAAQELSRRDLERAEAQVSRHRNPISSFEWLFIDAFWFCLAHSWSGHAFG